MGREPSYTHILDFSWEAIEEEFQVCVETLSPLKFETLSDKGKRQRRKLKSDLSGNVMPVGPNTNAVELEEWRKNALEIAETLAPLIQKRRATLELVLLWGSFQYSCGMVVSAPTAWQEDAGRKRSGLEGGKAVAKDEHRRWVARELIQRIDGDKLARHIAEKALADAIRKSISRRTFPQGLSAEWLSGLLDKNLLKDAYTQKRIGMARLRELAKEPINKPRL